MQSWSRWTGRKGCLVDATKQSAGVSFWFMSVRSNATNVRGMRLARCRNRIIVSRLSCYAFSRFRPLMRLSHMPVLLVSCGNNKFKRRKRFCRVVTRVERTPPEKFSPPWKNVLNSLKKWPPLSKLFAPPGVPSWLHAWCCATSMDGHGTIAKSAPQVTQPCCRPSVASSASS